MNKRTLHRGLTALAMASVGAIALAACSSTVPAPAEGEASGSKVIGVSIADQKSLFYVAAVDGMEQAAEEAGYELVVLSADNDATKQVNQVQDLITQNVGVLIYTPQDATAAAAGVKLANDAGVPVVAVDQKPESGDGKLATYIATDSVKAAYELCTWMFDQIGNAGDIAVLQGPLGATAELQRTEGCKKALDENPDVTVVAWEAAGWDETQAFEASQNILTANQVNEQLDQFLVDAGAVRALPPPARPIPTRATHRAVAGAVGRRKRAPEARRAIHRATVAADRPPLPAKRTLRAIADEITRL